MAKQKQTGSKPGPKPKVTLDLVRRVSAMVAKGIPIRTALAGEAVTQAAYEKHLQRHPELSALQEKAKREFLEMAIDRLMHTDKFLGNICWLLERRHSDLFGKPADVSVNVSQNTVVGPVETLSDEQLESIARRSGGGAAKA